MKWDIAKLSEKKVKEELISVVIANIQNTTKRWKMCGAKPKKENGKQLEKY
jgi:hypothetical protein